MSRTDYHKAYKAQYRSEKRSVTITVSRADYERLLKAAAQESKRPTTLVHDLAFAAFDRQLYVPADLKAQLRDLNFVLLNVSNNINQLAHWANANERAGDMVLIKGHIRQLHDAVVAFTTDRLKRR